jgi:3-hydroxymyristoyl/3-hydroxydecanoyl-(acyl carrier protein) dehydratase
MPGVLIIEAMAQTAAVGVLTAISDPEKRGAYMTGVDKCRFRRPVVPGDQLRLEVEIVSMRMRMGKCRGVATVDGNLCAEAEISSVLVDRP